MRKLQNYHSPNLHNIAVETHLRRLARNEGTGPLKENIQPVYNVFLEKLNAMEQAEKACTHGSDDIDYYDTILDNEIKNSSYDAKSYDVKSQKPPVYNILFPGGGYGPITRMNKLEEPAEAEALAKRFENLGEEHPLFHYAADIRAHVVNSNQAIADFKILEDNVANAKADLDVAGSNLRAKYWDNYLKACSQFGEVKAESFFSNSF